MTTTIVFKARFKANAFFFVVSHLPLQLQLWKPCHLVVKATISRKVNSFNLSTFVILMKFDETNWRVDKLNHLLINPCLVSKRLNFFFCVLSFCDCCNSICRNRWTSIHLRNWNYNTIFEFILKLLSENNDSNIIVKQFWIKNLTYFHL